MLLSHRFDLCHHPSAGLLHVEKSTCVESDILRPVNPPSSFFSFIFLTIKAAVPSQALYRSAVCDCDVLLARRGAMSGMKRCPI